MNDAGERIGDARLCRNSARMTFQHDYHLRDFKWFERVLEFNEKGEFVDPDYGIDRKTGAYRDDVSCPSRTPQSINNNIDPDPCID